MQIYGKFTVSYKKGILPRAHPSETPCVDVRTTITGPSYSSTSSISLGLIKPPTRAAFSLSALRASSAAISLSSANNSVLSPAENSLS